MKIGLEIDLNKKTNCVECNCVCKRKTKFDDENPYKKKNIIKNENFLHRQTIKCRMR